MQTIRQSSLTGDCGSAHAGVCCAVYCVVLCNRQRILRIASPAHSARRHCHITRCNPPRPAVCLCVVVMALVLAFCVCRRVEAGRVHHAHLRRHRPPQRGIPRHARPQAGRDQARADLLSLARQRPIAMLLHVPLQVSLACADHYVYRWRARRRDTGKRHQRLRTMIILRQVHCR